MLFDSKQLIKLAAVKCCVIYRKPSEKFKNNKYNASYILENNLKMHKVQLHVIFLSYSKNNVWTCITTNYVFMYSVLVKMDSVSAVEISLNAS